MRILLVSAACAVGLCLLPLGALAVFQRRLIYPGAFATGARARMPVPAGTQAIVIATADGERLHGLWRRAAARLRRRRQLPRQRIAPGAAGPALHRGALVHRRLGRAGDRLSRLSRLDRLAERGRADRRRAGSRGRDRAAGAGRTAPPARPFARRCGRRRDGRARAASRALPRGAVRFAARRGSLAVPYAPDDAPPRYLAVRPADRTGRRAGADRPRQGGRRRSDQARAPARRGGRDRGRASRRSRATTSRSSAPATGRPRRRSARRSGPRCPVPAAATP